MKRLKHILMGLVLLSVVLPCAHSLEHPDHGHNSAAERCALDGQPCECHSCDHKPCASDNEIQFHRTSDSNTIEPSSAPALLFILPEAKSVLKQPPSLVLGSLATIKTVQLLI